MQTFWIPEMVFEKINRCLREKDRLLYAWNDLNTLLQWGID